jgi:hypothetical protein
MPTIEPIAMRTTTPERTAADALLADAAPTCAVSATEAPPSRVYPHRHSLTFPGTRRSQAGQAQPAPAEAL